MNRARIGERLLALMVLLLAMLGAACFDDLSEPVDESTPAVVTAEQALGGCVCPFIWAPVCGVDGVTYSNDCVAACDGVDILHEGECEAGAFDCSAINGMRARCSATGAAVRGRATALAGERILIEANGIEYSVGVSPIGRFRLSVPASSDGIYTIFAAECEAETSTSFACE